MPQGELKQPLASDKEVRQTIKQTLRKMEKDGIVYRKPIMDFTTLIIENMK
jgi:DNA-binding HxlR family transcriptional regulator